MPDLQLLNHVMVFQKNWLVTYIIDQKREDQLSLLPMVVEEYRTPPCALTTWNAAAVHASPTSLAHPRRLAMGFSAHDEVRRAVVGGWVHRST